MDWGIKAGIFLNGVQVGALHNWTMEEMFKDPDGSPESKGMNFRKIIGWRVSAVRYLIKRSDLIGKELGFKFMARGKDLICKGKIKTNYKAGIKSEGIEIEGEKSPRIIWRDL